MCVVIINKLLTNNQLRINCFVSSFSTKKRKKYYHRMILWLVISKAVLPIASQRWVIYRPIISTQEQYRPMMSLWRLQITHIVAIGICVQPERVCVRVYYIENVYYMERLNIRDKNYMKIERLWILLFLQNLKWFKN